MTLYFYRNLSVFDVLSQLRGRAGVRVYYFDASPSAERMISVLKLGHTISKASFIMGEIKDAQGLACFERWKRAHLALCDECIATLGMKFAVFSIWDRYFDIRRMRNFYRLALAKDIDEFTAFLCVIDWYRAKLSSDNAASCVFYAPGNVFFETIRDYAAREFAVDVRPARRFGVNWFRFMLSTVKQAVLVVGEAFFAVLAGVFHRTHSGPANVKPRIANAYTMRGLTFDPVKRCDFPWLLPNAIDRQYVLLYFERPDFPVTGQMAKALRAEGVDFLAMSGSVAGGPEVPLFTPSIVFARKIAVLLTGLAGYVIRCMLRCRKIGWALLPVTVTFIREYALFYDFFTRYSVKVNVDFVEHDLRKISRILALRDVGGVSVSFQVSNWPLPNVILGSNADVFFMFGEHYRGIFGQSGATSETVILSGYIGDYVFKTVKPRSDALRARLRGNGARFVVSFFDENPSSARMSTLPVDRLSFVYRTLLAWTIGHKDVGLVCSPKRPKSLLQKLPAIEPLMREAIATGRCVFMDGEYAADNNPIEAGLASDIAVCLLGGGTTALEHYLAGHRAVFLDLEGFYTFDEYLWGRDVIVFDDIKKFLIALEAFRIDPRGNAGFGDPGKVVTLAGKDPFTDGKSVIRMSGYLADLLRGFREGMTREAAVAFANGRYISLWGRETVHEGSPVSPGCKRGA